MTTSTPAPGARTEHAFTSAVEELAEATGRTIRYLPVPTSRSAALLAEGDVPEAVVERLTRVFAQLPECRG